MSFYTSLSYYRPRNPPNVTLTDLELLCEQIAATDSLEECSNKCLQVKFGRAIDQDTIGTSWQSPVNSVVATIEEIEWDLNASKLNSLQDAFDEWKSEQRPVYRAHIDLGTLKEEVVEAITRAPSAENELGFYPGTLSLSIEPVQICDLSSDELAFVGWIELSFHGNGYLYPWTIRELVSRASHCEEILRLTRVCRAFWPVPALLPDPEIVEARSSLGELWPYDDLDKPWDWYWGVQET